MRPAARPGSVRRQMDGHEPVFLQLELHSEDRPVTGAVVGPDGAAHAFIGWLGLVAVLERVGGLAAAADRPHTPEEDHR